MSVRNLSEIVGEGGTNAPDDVFTVQMLLNHVDSAAGGPTPPLDVDGLVGPKTIGGIRRFQLLQLSFQDGRSGGCGRRSGRGCGPAERARATAAGLRGR